MAKQQKVESEKVNPVSLFIEDVYKTTDKYNRFSPENQEILNPTPMQPPIGYKRTPSLAEQIREQVRRAREEELNAIQETEEEADDFEIEEDQVMTSRWENDMIPSIKETRARIRELEEQAKLYANPVQPGRAGGEEEKKETEKQPSE